MQHLYKILIAIFVLKLRSYQISAYEISNFDLKKLTEVINGPLKDDNIHLISERETFKMMNFTQFESKSLILTSIDDGFRDSFETATGHQQGSQFTIVFIIFKIYNSFLEYIENSKIWNPEYTLIFSPNKTLDLSRFISSLAIRRSKYLTIFRKTKNSQNREKYSVYLVVPFQPYQRDYSFQKFIGNWNSRQFYTKSLLFPNRFENFGGTTFALASWCDDFPFIIFDENNNCFGSSIDLLDLIGRKLNFTYDIQFISPDGNWGALENGNWTGMLADLAYHNKDMLVNAFLLTEERVHGFDFIYPNHQEGFAVMIAIPPEIPKWIGLLYPFSWLTWIALIFTVFIVCAVFYLLLLVRRNVTADNPQWSLAFIMVC